MEKTISTPRRSRLSVVGGVVLLLMSLALLAFAYWGWGMHRSFAA